MSEAVSPGSVAKTSALAIAALVTAIIPCTWWLGLILGIVALVRISGRPLVLKGKGLAIAAMAIGGAYFVLAVLAGLAIPNFMKFQARAKQSEAKANLRALYTSAKSYEMDHDEMPNGFADIDFAPASPHRYAYFMGSEVLQADQGGPYDLPEDIAASADPKDTLGWAVANLDTDATLDIWRIDRDGKVDQVQDDVKE